jgi:hypothetical protein
MLQNLKVLELLELRKLLSRTLHLLHLRFIWLQLQIPIDKLS